MHSEQPLMQMSRCQFRHSEFVRGQYPAVDLTEAESLLAVLAVAEAPDDDVVAVLDELSFFTRVVFKGNRSAAAPTKFQHRAK